MLMLVATYNRPPNFLLVDYYNVGSGSVFEVAAKYNNVTYNRPCCGNNLSSGAANLSMSYYAVAFTFIVTSSFFVML